MYHDAQANQNSRIALSQGVTSNNMIFVYSHFFIHYDHSWLSCQPIGFWGFLFASVWVARATARIFPVFVYPTMLDTQLNLATNIVQSTDRKQKVWTNKQYWWNIIQNRGHRIKVRYHTVPLQWLHMSHIGISAKVASPVVLGILFWRVITVDTAHLEQKMTVRNR